MKNSLTRVALAALLAMAGTVPAWSAGPAADAAQVQQQAGSLASLQTAVATAAGFKGVSLKSVAHRITVTVTNSPLANPADREAQATKMVAALETGIQNNPAFSQINAIHVNYVKRTATRTSTVQGLDYFQTPAGAFVTHKS
ncbi:hypothetical protein BH11PSE7_BH11PSE7_37870 [soil metagenome]